jgi:hypothetical protein
MSLASQYGGYALNFAFGRATDDHAFTPLLEPFACDECDQLLAKLLDRVPGRRLERERAQVPLRFGLRVREHEAAVSRHVEEAKVVAVRRRGQKNRRALEAADLAGPDRRRLVVAFVDEHQADARLQRPVVILVETLEGGDRCHEDPRGAVLGEEPARAAGVEAHHALLRWCLDAQPLPETGRDVVLELVHKRVPGGKHEEIGATKQVRGNGNYAALPGAGRHPHQAALSAVRTGDRSDQLKRLTLVVPQRNVSHDDDRSGLFQPSGINSTYGGSRTVEREWSLTLHALTKRDCRRTPVERQGLPSAESILYVAADPASAAARLCGASGIATRRRPRIRPRPLIRGDGGKRSPLPVSRLPPDQAGAATDPMSCPAVRYRNRLPRLAVGSGSRAIAPA